MNIGDRVRTTNAHDDTCGHPFCGVIISQEHPVKNLSEVRKPDGDTEWISNYWLEIDTSPCCCCCCCCCRNMPKLKKGQRLVVVEVVE